MLVNKKMAGRVQRLLFLSFERWLKKKNGLCVCVCELYYLLTWDVSHCFQRNEECMINELILVNDPLKLTFTFT